MAGMAERELCRMAQSEPGFRLSVSPSSARVFRPGKRCDAGHDRWNEWAPGARRGQRIYSTGSAWSERLHHRPAQLSGGERQRVAIARALVLRPACVLMDEPTVNLDAQAAEQVLQLIGEQRRETTASFVLVTHNQVIAGRMDARHELVDGRLRKLSP